MEQVLIKLLKMGGPALGIFVSGVVLNWLVHRWQHRNWLHQQKITKATAELEALKLLSEKIRSMADNRNYRARKICRSIGRVPTKRLSELQIDHDRAVTDWMDNWNYFMVGLTTLADFSKFAKRLEWEIQPKFVEAGGLVKYCFDNYKESDLSHAKARLEKLLDSLSGETFNFTRDLSRVIQKKANEAFDSPRENLTRENLEKISTWQLFKSLFKSC